MLDFSGLWLLFVLFLLPIAYWYLTIPKNLPPGPCGYPIVGSLLSVGERPYLAFKRLGNIYGNIISVYFGSKLVVVLNDYEAIKEAFIKQGNTFSGRNDDKQFVTFEGVSPGLLFSEGEYWRQHRRFLLSNLRDNGVGKLSLEPLLLNEIRHFLNELTKHNGHPFDIRTLLNSSLTNNILILITGQRYDYDRPQLKETIEIFFKSIQAKNFTAPSSFFPWMKHIPGIGLITNIQHKRQLTLSTFTKVKEIVETAFNESENTGDDIYAHAYLKERRRRLLQNENETIFTELGLLLNSKSLFAAGSETSSTTLLWSLLYMTFYPEVQKKVRDEIDRVIGGDREPSYNDRFNTPYTEATIMEVLRIVTIAPLSIPHRNTRETTLFGYHIPKDTMIIPNLYAVHHDPKLWGDPDNFRPERFIGEDGKLIKPDYFIPFSIGKRACVGEPLAKMELYLYFVSLFQHFDAIPAAGVDKTLKSIDAVVRHSACSVVCLKQR